MKHTLYKADSYKTSQWMGGTTQELAISPATSSYLERNFVWRISSATIETEESTFSKLPDYDRVLMVLDGEVVLSYENQRVARLTALEQDRFDGGWSTKSFGKIKDFNLMVRKGSEGYLDLMFPTAESCQCASTEETEKTNATHALFCKEGYCVVNFGDGSQMIKSGEMLVLEYGDEKVSYSVMGEGTVIRAQIFYDDMSGEVGPEIIPKEKATFDDFKMCVYLANIQFRWAKYIIKKLKTTWFDQELSKAIKKIERFYLPTIIFFIGMAIIGSVAISKGASAGVAIGLIVLWLLIDCVIISPAMYMAVVPKPVRKHIKNIADLTPYEQRVREEELGRNEAVEKILNKYKTSGRVVGRTDD